MMRVIVLTGLSGSGKSTALHALEDLGLYCIDNLPPWLLPPLAQQLQQHHDPHLQTLAVGIDARTHPAGLKDLPRILDSFREQGLEVRVVFLDAADEVLLTRFSETRRRHPLTSDCQGLREALREERQLLEPLHRQAALRLDTSHIHIHQLRNLIRESLQVLDGDAHQGLNLLVQSFGFKKGVPHDADFVFDLRCLPNPYWQPELRAYSGLDQPVIDFLDAAPEVRQMREDLIQFLERWIPYFQKANRSYLNLALGCTGGRHRSVYMVEAIKQHFAARQFPVLGHHQELS